MKNKGYRRQIWRVNFIDNSSRKSEGVVKNEIYSTD